jgi:integrase
MIADFCFYSHHSHHLSHHFGYYPPSIIWRPQCFFQNLLQVSGSFATTTLSVKEQKFLQKQKTRFVEFVKDFNQYTQSNYAQGNKDLYERAFRNFQLIFGNITLRSITPLHWEKYKISRLQNRAPVTVNIELRCMKAALNVAKQWNLIESNPFSSLKQCPVVEKSPSFFSKANLRLLVNSIKVQWLKEIVLFAVLTGMREGEILHLRWQNIDFERKMIAIQLTCPRFMCQ